MGSAEQAQEQYQAGIKHGDDIRATMWHNHDNVVSALTTHELTHEEARQIAEMRQAIDERRISDILKSAVVLCDMFDDDVFDYVGGLTE